MSDYPEEVNYGSHILIHTDKSVMKYDGMYTNNWTHFRALFVTSGLNEPERRPPFNEGDSLKVTMFNRRTVALVRSTREDTEPVLGHMWSLSLEISEHDFPFTREECRTLGWIPFVLVE